MHVFLGKVVDGQMTLLVHELHAATVGHGLAVEDGPHPFRGILEVEGVGFQYRGVEVERAGALFAERS